ncbi:MAG: tRNA pseudouridine(55) synthase TruB [Pseudomonadota bacterium]
MPHDRRDLHGVFLLDKPRGMSSNHALQRVKRLLRAKKAGHTGSLDPLATGMLPICLGDATRLSQYLLDADKSYDVVARLGQSSTTGDAEGEITTQDSTPSLNREQWQEIAARFLGEIQQIPPMYSALKHDGKRLYELARKGQEVERPARTVRVHSIEVTAVSNERLELSVTCSKGTYIRTLVEDLAAAAGTVAWTERLHRSGVAPFTQAMHGLEHLEALPDSADVSQQVLLPVASCVAGLPKITLDAADARRFCEGQALDLAALVGRFAVNSAQDDLLGVVEVAAGGEIVTRKVLSAARQALDSAEKP